MIRYALLTASFGLALSSASAGLAAPLSLTPQLKQAATSDLVQVKKYYKGKKYYRGKKYRGRNWRYRDWDRRRYRGRYWYGGRYWGRRYSYRPRYWRSWGCVNVGPVWYCP
jgi:hypothetical protein